MAQIKKEDIRLISDRFARINKDPKIQDARNNKSVFDFPGFSISDFNRAGKLSLWSLLKFTEFNREVRTGEHQEEPDSVIVVSASQKLSLYQELYAKAAIDMPMNVVVYPGHVGVSSLSFFTDFQDASSGNLLARVQRQYVAMDAATRKPVPQTWIEKGEVTEPGQPVVVPKFTPSPEAISYTFMIQHSDTDHVYHTNQATYVRLCCDAAANACNEGKLKNFSGDFFRYDVSGALIRYLGESFPGDDLEVTLWEDPDDLDSMFFHVMRLNKVIFAAKFSYYEPTISITSKL